ncbi:MAG: hypothetical protein AB9834_03165 [Lentimicrobium sp.]
MSQNQTKVSEIRLNKPLCIGIGGVSRSGKTFLAAMLHEAIRNSFVIHQDIFIPDKSEIPKIKNHIDWERPEAIDWVSLKSAILSSVLTGKTIIVEGLFAFQNPSIVDLFNKSIFINISKQEFFLRKKSDLRWGKEPGWYIKHIWESYLNFGQVPSKMKDILVIDGEKDFELQMIKDFLLKPDREI